MKTWTPKQIKALREKYKLSQIKLGELLGVTTNYVDAIRGNALNDIIAVGDFGTVLHYNGSTWYNFTPQVNLSNSVLYSVSIKGNIAVAVGTPGGEKAVAVLGIRK